MPPKIKITYEDLNKPEVDEIIAEEAIKSGRQPEAALKKEKVSLIHKSWFNLMMAGLFGAFIAWALVEPYLSDTEMAEGGTVFALLMYLSVGGLVGLMVGSMEGILSRNFRRALKAGVIGFAVGFGGGLVAVYAAGIVMQIIIPIGVAIVGAKAAMDPAHYFSGFMLVVFIRSIIWAVLGMAVGLGPGIALKSKKLTLNGFIGGMIGGAIGGLLFDPINYIVSGGTFKTGVEVSRGIGFVVVGATAGYMIGMVETLTKDAWLLMTAGPLTGKQFIVYKNPTIIGSSPRCEIYLFKDPAIDPEHAAIHIVRDGYILEDKNTQNGTLVNGQRIKKKRLQNGDEIQIGEVRFVYSEKEKEKGNRGRF
jgi:hypothetical protein